jgi:hypothetical protein
VAFLEMAVADPAVMVSAAATTPVAKKYADSGLEVEVGKTILDLDLSSNGANALTAERRSVS